MRLLKLKVKNLASLKGEHEINFQKINEASPLFAITGETGAGKSTILNAIALVLFGKNYKKNINQNDLVTLGADSSEITLFYEVKGKKFKNHWKIRLRKKNGDLIKKPQPAREIFEINQDQEIMRTEQIEDILGLNFDQFTKTVILNQGEFSKFLLATFTERKEILERFYSADILSKIGKLSKFELEEVKREMQEQNKIIEGIQSGQIENPEEIKEEIKKQKDKILRKEESQASLKKITLFLRDILNDLQIQKNNEIREKTTEEELHHLTNNFNIQKKNYDKQSIIFEETKKNVEEESKNLSIAALMDKDINHLRHEKDEKEKLIKENIKKEERLEDLLKERINLLEKINQDFPRDFKKETYTQDILENDLNKIRSYIKLSEDENFIEKEMNSLLNQREKEKESGKKLSQEERILKEEILKIKDEKALEEELIYKRSLDDLLRTFKNDEIQLNEEIEKIKTKTKEINLREEELKINLEKQDKEHQYYLKEIKYINDSLELYELKEAINLCLHKSLEDGQCVICHSEIKERNIQEDVYNATYQKTKEDKINLEEKIKESHGELQKLTLLLSELRKKEEELTNEIKERENNFKDKYQKLKELGFTSTAIKDEINELLNQQTKRKILLNNLKNIEERLNSARNNYREIKLQDEKLNKEIKIKNDEKEKIENNLKKYNLQSLEMDEILSLTEDLSLSIKLTHKEEITKKELELFREQKDENIRELATLKKNLEDLKRELDSLEKKRLTFTLHESPEDRLKEINQNFKLVQKEFEVIKESKAKLEIALAEGRANRDRIKQFKEELNVQIKSEITKLNNELLKAHFLDHHLEEFKEKFSKKTDLSTEDENIIKITSEVLQNKLSELQEEILILQKDKSKNETLLSEYEKGNKRKELLNLKIENLKEEEKEKTTLFDLVGNDRFRNFVLSKIEEELIFQTNKELRNLCGGRYAIIQESGARENPEFYIIDKLRDDEIRKVSTLSGGETFMVSLACALALAELSRGATDIDSFFIDEGFGTLDEESLNDVIEMLHEMENSGKQIGLISHVKKLTSRIPINIHLNKNNLGNSSISILYN